MAFVDETDEIFREEVQQSVRRFAGFPSVKVSAVIFDAAAIAHFAHHFDVVRDALADSLRLDKFIAVGEIFHPFFPVFRDERQGVFHTAFADDVMGCGENDCVFESRQRLSRKGVDFIKFSISSPKNSTRIATSEFDDGNISTTSPRILNVLR